MSGRRERAVKRRSVAAWVATTGAMWLLPRGARGEDVPVPTPLQMKLLAKVAAYDKNLPARAGDKVRLRVVVKPGDDDGKRVATQALSALEEIDSIADLPLEARSETFSDAAKLKAAIESQKLAIVYLVPGFSSADLEAVAKQLDGTSVLTAAALPTAVPKGVVLGFDLVSGKPKIVVNLPQARKQKVALSAEVLKLAKVIE